MALDTRSLLVVGVASAGWAFSFGLGSQTVSHWLKDQDVNDTVIGFNHAFYYLGLAVASFLAPPVARRGGTASTTAFGMFGSAATLLVYHWCGDEYYWYTLRFLNGCAGAFCIIPLETLVSGDSAPEHRTLNLGVYGVSLTIGGAIGIALAPHLYPIGYDAAFAVGSCVPVAAGFLVLLALPHRAHISTRATRVPLGWDRNFLSYGTAWGQGFLEGGMIAFLALFLEHAREFSKEAAGTLMSITTIGIILFQVPVSWLGDRVGKTPVLLGCYAVVAGCLATIPWIADSLTLAGVLFAFGACTGAMYPLGLSLLGERIAESGLARAYAWYLAIECTGNVVGAAAMGRARERWGEASMFAVGLAAILAVLIGWVSVTSYLQRENAIGGPS